MEKGGVRGAFLKWESEYMGRFCNSPQPAVFSSLLPSPRLFPLPHPELPPIFHQAPVLFLHSLPSILLPHTPCPLFPCSPCPLPWCPFHISFGPSGCLPWPPVLCFNVGPMGTGVHSKTGRACEQEAGSGAGGEQPAVTSAPCLLHLDRSIPRALCLSHCSLPALLPSVSALCWPSRPERRWDKSIPNSDTGEGVQGLH